MVIMLLADGFEEIEAVYPLDVLRRCGVEIKTVGVTGEYVTGSNGLTVKSDMGIEEVNPAHNIDMLILPGGAGRFNIQKSVPAMNVVDHCFKSDIPVAAICGAPEILGLAGYLKGRKAVCYPGLEDKMIGATFVDAPVVTDGKLITSRGAGTAEPFAFAVAEFLCGAEKAKEVFDKMTCIARD